MTERSIVMMDGNLMEDWKIELRIRNVQSLLEQLAKHEAVLDRFLPDAPEEIANALRRRWLM